MPKVSVVIPVYNVAQYIERCARSLFEQTLNDIEYLFIDDCSPDSSIDILEGILSDYPHRITQTKIIRLPENIGAANVRKKGIFLATGEYIIQCDSDDWVEPDMYELMYNKAVSGDFDMVLCDIYRSHKYSAQPLKHNDKRSIIIDFLIGESDCELWNKLVKRQIFTKDIIYPVSHLAEDWALTPQMLYYSNKIGYLNKALYHYCLNSESITQSLTRDKVLLKVSQHLDNAKLLFAFFQRESYALPEYVKDIMKWRCRIWYTPIINTDEGYALWKNLYPELNKTFLFHTEIPLKRKIGFTLDYLRLTRIKIRCKILLRKINAL